MDWTRAFYHKQAAWSNAYPGEITAWHRARAQRVREVIGAAPKNILELGAGSGQDALALAELGYDIVAVEREPLLTARFQQLLAQRPPRGHVRVIEDDFYRVTLPQGHFDAVCYWDGFGIGTDADQRRLLKRIRRWLKPEGLALLDIYTPWHASLSAGYSETIGQARRTYGFDAEHCRWLDTWTHEGESVTQSLRCYSPADLRLLLEGTGLTLVQIWPGGKRDYTTGRFYPTAPLAEAMWYTAVLQPAHTKEAIP